jgi:hypothetical protein
MGSNKQPQDEQALKALLNQIRSDPKAGQTTHLTDEQAKQLALRIKKLLRQHLN